MPLLEQRADDGNLLLRREDNVPDSERNISRDDVLLKFLAPFFIGDSIHFDLEDIAAAYNARTTSEEEKVTPEEIFSKIHGYYGYMCLGTGENPAFNETLTEEEKVEREQAMKRALIELKLPHILITGKYMGVIENTYFIPFNDQTIGLPTVLQSDRVQKVAAIATTHQQDSLLICHKGYACYLYTSGQPKGSVITGKTAVVYPGEKQLPTDCYSLFLGRDSRTGIVGFTCGLNFGRIYATIDEYAASENKTLQAQYRDFLTKPPEPTTFVASQKIVILLRGTDGYNQYAIDLQNQLRASGLKVAIFGTDANIAALNEEIGTCNQKLKQEGTDEDKAYVKKLNENELKKIKLSELKQKNGADYTDPSLQIDTNLQPHPRWPKAGWEWTQIRDEFVKRNQEIYRALLLRGDIDVVVYADMNKLLTYMQPMITQAKNADHVVLSHVVNSFVFEEGRSDYVKTLCDQYGPYMGRHVTDFNDLVRSQITAPVISINVTQYHSLPVGEFADLIARKLSELKKLTCSAQASAAALAGAGIFAPSAPSIPVPTSAQPSTAAATL